jgi:hypothetical protein
VSGGISVEPYGLRREQRRGVAAGFGGLGGVLGQICGDRGDFAPVVDIIRNESDRAGVDLGSPADQPAFPAERGGRSPRNGVPALPSSLTNPLWDQFAALLLGFLYSFCQTSSRFGGSILH